jgi:aryl-alcohol dehydrogenase-like predicted oxidoreductase
MPLSATFPLAGRDVPRVGYGAMQLTRSQQPDRDAGRALLREVVASGVRHLDTAEFYDGVNALIREALHPYDESLVIATKVGAAGPEGALRPAQKPAELREQVEANLRSLGAERLGVVYLRRTDQRPGIVAEGEQNVPLDDQLAELAALRDEGKLDAIGLSAVTLEQLRQALPAGIAAVQNAYNLAARAAEPELELAAEHGVAWVPFFPLGSAWDPRDDIPAFRRLMAVTALPQVTRAAERLGATPSQVALAWLLQHRENVLLIPGTRSPAHAAENRAAAELELPADVVAELDAVAADEEAGAA